MIYSKSIRMKDVTIQNCISKNGIYLGNYKTLYHFESLIMSNNMFKHHAIYRSNTEIDYYA